MSGLSLREEHLAKSEHHCSFCRHTLANPAFSYDVWDKLRFGDPVDATEAEWAQEALSHEPDCPWIYNRGACFWTA